MSGAAAAAGTAVEATARRAALLARYDEAAAALPEGPWNAVLACLTSHRSVRAFLPDALPAGTLETVVAAAQSAATSSNMQTWSVVAVSDPTARAELARLAAGQRHIEECPLFLVFLADLSRLERVGRAAGSELEGLPFLETFLVAALDAAIAAQNAAVAAESLGLGTVYIGAIRNEPEEVARVLGLPQGVVAVTGLCVGRADPARDPGAVKPRLSQAAVLHRDRYDAADDAAREGYDRALERFSASSERQSYSWTERVLSRMGRLRALAGRDRLREALERRGFPLR